MSNGNEPTRLLVPIHIDGLVVGTSFPSDKIFQWTNLAPNFAKLSGSYLFGAELGGDSDSNGNPFEKAADLQPGIHLHFRLPRALTHGSQSGAEKISFPPIPNRWLVQRYGGSGRSKWQAIRQGLVHQKRWSASRPCERNHLADFSQGQSGRVPEDWCLHRGDGTPRRTGRSSVGDHHGDRSRGIRPSAPITPRLVVCLVFMTQ
jgi:hypothetical protein